MVTPRLKKMCNIEWELGVSKIVKIPDIIFKKNYLKIQKKTGISNASYFVLDAASCVKEQWGEMLLRMNLFARRANDNKNMVTRFSVIRYATSGIVDIPINNNLNYNQFIADLTKLSWLNEGSFLNKGLDEVEGEIQRNGNSVCFRAE